MKFQRVAEILLKDWLLILSALGLLAMSTYSGRVPVYSRHELQVLYFLFLLFVAVKGLEHSGLLRRVSQHFEHGRAIPVKLVVLTFFLSMLVTNDVALIVIVPLTLLLNYRRLDLLVILEALAANAGSALTPFGNPQNLFIFWFYQVPTLTFLHVIAPLSFVSFVLLVVAAWLTRHDRIAEPSLRTPQVNWQAYSYLACLLLVILSVLRVLPWWSSLLVIVYVLIFDRRSFRIDYALLLSFVCLFGLADELDALMQNDLVAPGSVFMFSALLSQVMSNVPATVLLAKFTNQWPALLWGVNVGGFGSLIGSLANVIAYRLYVRHIAASQVPLFTVRFLATGYLAFGLGIGLYFLWHGLR